MKTSKDLKSEREKEQRRQQKARARARAKAWQDYFRRMSEAARHRPEPLPCPRCGREWRVSDRELALPPGAICPPCKRES